MNGSATCTSCGLWSGYNPWGVALGCLIFAVVAVVLGFGAYGVFAVGCRLSCGEWPWNALWPGPERRTASASRSD